MGLVCVGFSNFSSMICPPQVDFVVVDGSPSGLRPDWHGAKRFLVQLAGVPAAIWCGNFALTFGTNVANLRILGRNRADKNFSEWFQSSYREVTDQLQIGQLVPSLSKMAP